MTIHVNDQHFMWEMRYRPATIDEAILPAADKKLFKQIVADGRIPNMILHSASPGTGKTTSAMALANEIDAEVMFVNGADAKIDFIRNDITRFASSKTLKPGGKVVIIDEFDRAGLADSQRHLRSFMEAHGDNCTFIITANNINGIIEALQSRCRVIHFGQATQEDKTEMMKQMIVRASGILKLENIPLETPKVLLELVKKNFPDFRKTINELDFYSKNGKIDAGILSLVLNDRSDISELVEAIKAKKIKDLRALAPKYATDYAGLVQKLTNTLYEELSQSESGRISIPRMIEIIGENNQYYGLAANAEIHIMFMFVQLAAEITF